MENDHDDLDAPDPLFIGEWIEFRGLKPADVCRNAGITEGYLSALINREKLNPTAAMLSRIARAIGIPTGQLFGLPPIRTLRTPGRRAKPESRRSK